MDESLCGNIVYHTCGVQSWGSVGLPLEEWFEVAPLRLKWALYKMFLVSSINVMMGKFYWPNFEAQMKHNWDTTAQPRPNRGRKVKVENEAPPRNID